MIPGDALAAQVQRYVATQVPPHLVVPVTEATCRTVGTLMADPGFTRQLRVVQELLEEIQWLKTQVLHQQRIISTSGSATGSRPRKRSGTSKKASPKAAASPRTGSSTTTKAASTSRARPAVQKGFQQGVKQARR